MTDAGTTSEPTGRRRAGNVAPWRRILPVLVPAGITGIACSLVLIATSALAKIVDKLWWTWLPDAGGFAADSRWWIAVVLGASGVLIAAWVGLVPGHAGPDPATTSLVSAPLPLVAVPGLLVAVVLMLGGGVSLGPENPIMAANVALMIGIGGLLLPRIPSGGWMIWAISGTVGALFSTPVAAALILSEIIAGREGKREPLWDALAAPLVAAAAGAMTTKVMGGPQFALPDLTIYRGFEPIDVISGIVIAVTAAIIGLGAVYLFPIVHRLFATTGRQVVSIALAGLVLAGLGAIGGTITMFKGLDEMKRLTTDTATGSYGAWALIGIIVIKSIAVVVASAGGFRGGRIFPMTFVGVAIGLLAHQLVPAVPVTLAVACATLGMLMTVTRQGWMALFLAIVLVPDMRLLPLLCVAAVAAWLTVSGRPEMLIPTKDAIVPANQPADLRIPGGKRRFAG